MTTWLGGFEGGLAHGLSAANIETFKDWLWDQPRVRGLRLICFHNSYRPDMAMTDATPGGYDQRQRNLVGAYKGRWRGGPAFNVYPDGTIRGGTPWGLYGIHSPSWNDFGIGIEGMADFDHDDDDVGRGLVIKNTICEMIAAILRHHGLFPNDDTIKLHKEDRATTHHGCPGRDIEKPDIMARVHAYYDAMGTPGEHVPATDAPVPVTPQASVTIPGATTTPQAKPYVVTKSGLNLRQSGGMAGKIVTTLDKDQAVRVWSTSRNASTVWAHITGTKDNGVSYFDGYVALAYLREAAWPPVNPLPIPGPILTVPTPVVIPVPTDRPHWAMQLLMGPQVAWPAFRAAGAVGNSQRESYPDMRTNAAGDRIGGGEPTAFSIWQLRNERVDLLKAFAAERGKDWSDFETEVLFMPYELKLSEHLAWDWLQRSENVEQATAAMAFYERPAGYLSKHAKAARTWDEALAVARACDGWDKRLAFAQARLASV